MYKKLTLEQANNINTWFFKNLQNLYKNQRYTTLKEFLKDIWKNWDQVYFFESANPVFRFTKKDNKYIITDEVEKIEILLNEEELNSMHRFLKDEKKITKIKKDNKTILESLIEDFENWNLCNIKEMPYIVYDIETIWDMNNLKKMKFMLWYSALSQDDHKNNIKYKLVSQDNLKKFVDYLLDFDGYIVWYNNIYFDNPVIIYNIWYTDKEIQLLNQKSIDLFLFIRNLTWRRLGLDKVSSALISVSKTLSSWLEWTKLLIEYEKTWDKKLLTKVQNYCKNDVKMTLGVMLYLMKYQNLYLDGEEINYDINDLIKLWNQEKNKKSSNNENLQNIFDN